MSKLRIVVLISGTGRNLQAIIDSADQLNLDIAVVISNRPKAYGLERASSAGITTQVLDHTLFDGREAFDSEMMKLIDNYQPDLVVLAGFMRILTTEFCQHYSSNMLNIHPSLLPKYKGLNTHQRALDSGDTEHGLSIHYVTAELDGGPVVLQARVNVLDDDTPDTLAARVLDQELLAYPTVLKLISDNSLHWQNGAIHYQGRPLQQPLQLDELKEITCHVE